MMATRRLDPQALRPWLLSSLLTGATLFTACSPYEMRHENQSDARTQIWLSEESQVKVRAAQTRVFETSDRRKMLQAIVLTLQDLNCKIEVLDEQLGIVSAKKYVALEQPTFIDPAYLLYRPDTLLFLTRNYRPGALSITAATLCGLPFRFALATIRSSSYEPALSFTFGPLRTPCPTSNSSAFWSKRSSWKATRQSSFRELALAFFHNGKSLRLVRS